jgi:translation initiation factor IF-2
MGLCRKPARPCPQGGSRAHPGGIKQDRSTNADLERVLQQLAEIGLVPDAWDGDTIVVPMSAKRREGLEDLLEAILLVAENNDIRANPEGRVIGTVIEAEIDRARGVLATLLVQNGTLNVGDAVVVGTAYGRLRAMFDHLGHKVRKAGPSTPVSVMGLNDVPRPATSSRSSPQSVSSLHRLRAQRVKKRSPKAKRQQSPWRLFDRFQAGEVRELRLLVKADVQVLSNRSSIL